MRGSGLPVVTLLVFGMLAAVLSPARANAVLTCNGEVATIVGTNGNDVINGTSAADVIVALKGADTIYAKEGADIICAGDGADVVFGGKGGDHIVGGDKADELHGGAGNDTVMAGNGNDTVKGGIGKDTLRGHAGDDLIFGGRGSDIVWGGRGADDVYGGPGNDVVGGGAGPDTVRGAAGYDTAFGGAGGDDLLGGSQADSLSGGVGADELLGGGGSDTLLGRDGNDTMTGGPGIDMAKGGNGTDTCTGAEYTPGCETRSGCDSSYPNVCIPSPPPVLECADVGFTDFKVIGADPHGFDTNDDGIGCPMASPPPATGMPYGVFFPPDESWGTEFTGGMLTMTPSSIIDELEMVRAAGGSLAVNLLGKKETHQNDDETFNLAMWKQGLDEYAGVDVSGYVEDGTLLVHYMTDEPKSRGSWGEEVIPNSLLDEMAWYSKTIWPTLPTTLRVSPTKLAEHAGGYDVPLPNWKWKYLDTAWAQYSARFGSVSDYVDAEIAEAESQGLGLIFGLNVIDGGDGSSGVPGVRDDKWSMSDQELLDYGGALIGSEGSCAFLMWRYDWDGYVYFERPEIADAVDELATTAASTLTPSCVQ